jgi:acetolactate synthase-1/2/3 large subunit
MVTLDVRIQADLFSFLSALEIQLVDFAPSDRSWLDKVSFVKAELPAVDKAIRERGHAQSGLNPYLFMDELWPMLSDDEIIVCADASASVIPFQVAPVKTTQRLFTNAGSASMGYELPAAIGAAFANRGRRIICMAGDGSIMLNIQELETIGRYKLPIKILLLNNQGYLSIKLSQQGFFNRKKGADLQSGLGFMSYKDLSSASKLAYCAVRTKADYTMLRSFLSTPDPGLAEIAIDPTQAFEPKLGSFRNSDGSIQSNSLENMSPPLPAFIINQLMQSSNGPK